MVSPSRECSRRSTDLAKRAASRWPDPCFAYLQSTAQSELLGQADNRILETLSAFAAELGLARRTNRSETQLRLKANV